MIHLNWEHTVKPVDYDEINRRIEEYNKKYKEISDAMIQRGISHFRYFLANTNYFNYYKCDGNK